MNPLIYQRTCRIQIVTVPEMGRSQDWLSRLDSNTICPPYTVVRAYIHQFYKAQL